MTDLPPDTLVVATTVFNPMRYKRRYELYRRFKAYVEATPGVKLLTVEVAFGGRPFEVTTPGDPWNVRLRTDDELWHKERSLKVGIQRIPFDWEFVMWADCDLTWSRPDWGEETVHQLRHCPVVQPFRHVIDLGPKDEPLNTFPGFAYCYRAGLPPKSDKYPQYGSYWHPGMVWSATREAYETFGGLLDFAIMGSADWHMAHAFIGTAEKTVSAALSADYRARVLDWQEDARALGGVVGYVDSTLFHAWHGSKVARKYRSRWRILSENKFEPSYDLKETSYGLWTLDAEKARLRMDIQDYMAHRNEDGLDV
jgi:hypothetical protein